MVNGTPLYNIGLIVPSYAQDGTLSFSNKDTPALMGVAMRGNHTSEKETEDSNIVNRRSFYEES
jgi:hypothetical protein